MEHIHKSPSQTLGIMVPPAASIATGMEGLSFLSLLYPKDLASIDLALER